MSFKPDDLRAYSRKSGKRIFRVSMETPSITVASPIPFSWWVDRQLQGLRSDAPLTGHDLLTERRIFGGGCQLYETLDGAIALNLSRPCDRELLPALFDGADGSTADLVSQRSSGTLVQRGREIGLAIADVFEDRRAANPAMEILWENRCEPVVAAPLVVDLSALWAGPLAGRLLRLSGAHVIKIESKGRPDAMRHGDPGLFDKLNGGKQQRALDFDDPTEINILKALLAKADVVIEAARPRALLQLGIDANAMVRAKPGLIWLSITGHGGRGDAANWVGFGDDCGVAAGLSAALLRATGRLGFVGDAIADPLTGVFAARTAIDALAKGVGGRFFLSMSGITAQALAEERAHDVEAFEALLCNVAARPLPC